MNVIGIRRRERNTPNKRKTNSTIIYDKYPFVNSKVVYDFKPQYGHLTTYDSSVKIAISKFASVFTT